MSPGLGEGRGSAELRPPAPAADPDPLPPLFRVGQALEVRVSDCIPLSQRGVRRLVSVEPRLEQPEPDFCCSRGAFTLLWPNP